MQQDQETEFSAKKLSQQVKHHLITMMGKTIEEASDMEFYRALSWALREEIMINWTATSHTHRNAKVRKVNYISMEWLPGRVMYNNITNVCQLDLVKRVTKILGRDFTKIMRSEPDPGLGNGGLGRLASCFLDSLATLKYPARGYGLRYQYGIFEQRLWSGVQIEKPDNWLLTEFPWEMRRDESAKTVVFGGQLVDRKNKHGETVHSLANFDDVRALAYDVPIIGYGKDGDYSALTLRLWTTKESPKNFKLARFNAGDLTDATKNTALTDVLYPNDKNSLGLSMRIKQEYLLVSSTIQDIMHEYHKEYNSINEFRDKVRIQINDTHPALTIAELMHTLTKHHELKWNEAFEVVQEVCSYTNHTVLKESLEEWDSEMLKGLLPRQHHIIERINFDFCNRVRSKYPNEEERIKNMSILEHGRVKMAHLAIVGSHKVNGVAKLHSDIIRTSMFKDFSDMFEDRFTNVTNGVTQRRWLLMCNRSLASWVTKHIGDGWISDFKQMEKLHDLASNSDRQKEFLEIKHQNKLDLMKYLADIHEFHAGGKLDLSKELFLDGNAMFDVHIKRIHEYKRQLMKALHTIMLYFELLENPSSKNIKRMIMIGGKAAPGYDMAKNIIRLIYCIHRKIQESPEVSAHLKLALLENYNVSLAEMIIPGTDLSEQISTAGQEASGTSNMKFTINGALTIGTDDGANVEMRQAVTDKWWPFLFGMSADEVHGLEKDRSYNPRAVLEADPQVKRAVNALVDGTFAQNEVEEDVLKSIYDSLINDANPDRYFIIKDLRSYHESQNKAEALYEDSHKWAEYAIHNMASMGTFSSDVSIQNYATKIWGIKPIEMDSTEFERVRSEFARSDRCYIA